MPYEIKLRDMPAGYALTSARAGDTVVTSTKGFVSSEDGDLFISRLEGLPREIIAQLPPEANITPSVIDHMLALIRKDKTATVYVNELEMHASIRIRKTVEKGNHIYPKDILDIERLKFPTVHVPEDVGLMLILSVGWRKGFYYDLSPLVIPDMPSREYDFEVLCGQYFAYLTFQDLFKITDDTWKIIFDQGWFPFIYLGQPVLKKILTHASEGWDIDELLPEISDELRELLTSAPAVWEKNPYFEPHLSLIRTAIERYNANDHVSASSILYPRIEGIMRTYYYATGVNRKPTSKRLAKVAIEKGKEGKHARSFLLPDRFRAYLDDVYFANYARRVHHHPYHAILWPTVRQQQKRFL